MERILPKLLPHFVFVLLATAVVVLSWNLHGELLPKSGLDGVWFYSGLALLLFAMFYVEPYYPAPRNVMTHSLAVILVLMAVRHDLTVVPGASPWWQLLLVYATAVLIISWLASNLTDEELAPEHWQNRAAGLLKVVSVTAGEARVLYSMVFLLFLLVFHDVRSLEVRMVLVFWWLLILTNPRKRMAAALSALNWQGREIGQIIAVQARYMFLARAHPNGPVFGPLESVEFSYAPDRDPNPIKQGIVLNSYFLENQKWFRVLQLEQRAGAVARPKAVYHVAPREHTGFADLTSRFLGVVVEQSEIGLLRFELVPGAPPVQEGDVVEVSVASDRVLYQIINGHTRKEVLESKNEDGFITVDAVQLGRWDSAASTFQRFGWLPEMHAPVLQAGLAETKPTVATQDYVLGTVPGTGLPIYMDLDAAVSHHLAILGITGSGKSFITFDLIRRARETMKVIAVDFTGEYAEQLATLSPVSLIDTAGLEAVEELMAEKADTNSKVEQLKLRTRIEGKLEGYVAAFAESDSQLALFELPDMSNTTFILEFTQLFLDSVFRYAKKRGGQKICIVVEEAHTVVPETTSLGDFGDYSSNKALVNKIGQIALQGRKYGVGFVIVAQRTANVSKTVLTQCNSLICFQAFDDTSFRFVENHLGRHMVEAMPRLRRYHAVVVGKAFRGDVPVIVDLTRKTSKRSAEESDSDLAAKVVTAATAAE